MLYKNYIDHALTRGYHPQSNGACEKIVGILKVALRKVLILQRVKEWRKAIFNIIAGYRMSRQSSTGFSPYYLLFGRQPLIPSGFIGLSNIPIDWNDSTSALLSLTQRAEIFSKIVPMAMDNMLIAQHRDKRRYERRYDRNQTYKTVRDIIAGDFVYMER